VKAHGRPLFAFSIGRDGESALADEMMALLALCWDTKQVCRSLGPGELKVPGHSCFVGVGMASIL
jgi:hypothetical protein